MIYGDRKDRDVLKRNIESLIGAINAVGQPHDGRPLPIPAIEQTYLDLIRRVKASLMGILAQLDYWPENSDLKVSISLLFRSCVTDVLLLLYLKTLEQHEATFENELKILDKPYVKFVASLIKSGALANSPTEIQQQLDELYNTAEPLISTTQPKVTFIKPEDIRATSDKSILHLDTDWIKRDPSTELQFEHLKQVPDFTQLSDLYWLYRHFSQHEHYSRVGSHFYVLPPEFECLQWYKSLIGCFEAVRLVSAKLGASEVLQEDLYLNVGQLYRRLLEHQQDKAADAQ